MTFNDEQTPKEQTASQKNGSGNKSRTSGASLADLRNQVTMVAGERGESSSASIRQFDDLLGNGSPLPRNESDFLPLPFEVDGYVVTERLAQGGMSYTYLGHKIDDESERITVKIPKMDSPKTVDMFRNECRVLEQFHHPGIVPIIKYGDTNVDGLEYPYMVMKFVSGQSLKQRIKTQGKLTWNEAAKVLEDVAVALKYLYENDFCHRDIKPDNIIYDTELDQWVLVDFGIAKSMQENLILTLTIIGQNSGTWDYMPPEQLEGKAVDIRCDIYALGTVIWEALLGKVPRRGTKFPHAFGIDVSPDVDTLIAKMVEHSIEERYQTPAEVLEALRKGAGKVEKWKVARAKFKTAKKIASWGFLVSVFLGSSWLTGNFFACAKTRETYEKFKSISPTLTLQELRKLQAKLPFWWGNSHLCTITPDLEKKSLEEAGKKNEEYLRIKDIISKHSGTIEELEKRHLQGQNYIKKWEGIFEDENFRFVMSNINVLSANIQKLKEEKLVEDTIRSCENHIRDKKASSYKLALDECHKIEQDLREHNNKVRITELINKIRKEAAGEALERIEVLLQSVNKNDWIIAYKEIDKTLKIIGNDPDLLDKQKKVDDIFWNDYYTKAMSALKENMFAQAGECIEAYRRTGLKMHIGDLDRVLSQIKQAKETFDWNETVKLCKKYMNDKNYRAALKALDIFKQTYPDTNAEIKTKKDTVVESFRDYVLDKWKNIDDYYEQMKLFMELCPDYSNEFSALQRNLCLSVFHEVREIINDKSMVAETKTARLAQIKYTDCNQEQKEYLQKLLSAASNYAAEGYGNNYYLFWYWYERPPKDCVKMDRAPSMYYVTIENISFDLSESDYNTFKGVWDADIKIHIESNCNYAGETTPYVNKKSGVITSFDGSKISFWVDVTHTKGVEVSIIDVDVFTYEPSIVGSFSASNFRYPGTKTWRNSSGTTISLDWTAQ